MSIAYHTFQLLMSEATRPAKEILPKLKTKVEESMQMICSKWLNVNLSCYNKKVNQVLRHYCNGHKNKLNFRIELIL